MNRILIIDDDSAVRTSARRMLEKQGHAISEATSVHEAERRFSLAEFALILADMGTPEAPGRAIIPLAGQVPVILMSSDASVRAAVQAIKMGAADFIAKPLDFDELAEMARAAVSEPPDWPLEPAEQPIPGMLGTCPEMLDLFERIRKVAPTTSNVLIEGESGTGKELVARAIHQGSVRRNRRMISLNCAAIPDTLIESELFGHERGAFTGATASRKGLVEAADGSSLFLDEVGELPMDAQARLLRVLQEGEVRRVGSVETKRVDVRLITATHRNLRALTRTGGFREDLYYRLNVVKLSLPPLRERTGDVEPLALEILRRTCGELAKPELTFTPAALDAINSYTWPGNIRELENAIERAVILCEDSAIDSHLLAIDTDPRPSDEGGADEEEAVGSTLEEYFLRFVQENQDHMTETELAERLGISRKTLWERRQRLNIPRVRSRKR